MYIVPRKLWKFRAAETQWTWIWSSLILSLQVPVEVLRCWSLSFLPSSPQTNGFLTFLQQMREPIERNIPWIHPFVFDFKKEFTFNCQLRYNYHNSIVFFFKSRCHRPCSRHPFNKELNFTSELFSNTMLVIWKQQLQINVMLYNTIIHVVATPN